MIESYLSGKTLLHRLDPRLKLMIIFFYSFLVAIEREWFPLFYASFLPLVCLFNCRAYLKKLGKRILVVNGFILLLWVILPFTYPGEKILSFGLLSPTVEGIYFCLLLTLKSNLIIITTILFLSTSQIFHLVHALHHLRVSPKLVQLSYFSYRYIPVIHTEYKRLHQAMKMRGFVPRNSPHTYRSIGYLVGMLLLRAYERSRRIYQAMLTRGFKGVFWTLCHFRWRKRDYLIAILCIFYFSGFFYLKLK